MLRRLKADVEKSLPPKHETILFTGMSAMQKKLYRDILIRDIDAIQGKNAGSRTAILNIVMQLRKCAGEFSLVCQPARFATTYDHLKLLARFYVQAIPTSFLVSRTGLFLLLGNIWSRIAVKWFCWISF